MKKSLKIILSVLLVISTVVSFTACFEKEEAPAVCTHEYDWQVVKPASCTEKGQTNYACKKCGEIANTQELEITAHEYEWKISTPATCTEKGQTNYTCKSCGNIADTKEVELTDHVYEWTVTIPATCVDSGKEKYTCKTCGDVTDEREIAPISTAHNYTWETIKAATCTEKGSENGLCSGCGDQTVRETEIVPHSYTWETTKAATCTEKGSENGLCSDCGDQTVREIEVIPHDYNWVTTEPTCTEKGIEKGTCSDCGDEIINEKAAALGHAPQAMLGEENYQLIHASTCTKYGKYKYLCAHGANTESAHWVEISTSPISKTANLLENMTDEQKAEIEKKAHQKSEISNGEQCSGCGYIWSTDIYICQHLDCKVKREDGSSYCSYCGTEWGPPVSIG